MDPYKTAFRPTSPTRPITPECPRSKASMRFGMWQKLQHFFGREGSLPPMNRDDDTAASNSGQHRSLQRRGASSARPVGVGLPRQATFRRQNSERRERLCPVEPPLHERRAFSASRPKPSALSRFRSNSVPPTSVLASKSAPAIGITCTTDNSDQPVLDIVPTEEQDQAATEPPVEYDRLRPPRPPSITSSVNSYDEHKDAVEDRTQLDRDLDTKWILNLSMHFRDRSDREKFFVTYAETPTRWRRVTVSCDYRNAEPKSLEMDLKELQLQRDKSMQIYEAIRESLLEIQFYDTVTNLKLETSDGRLHVHVTEDVNEIIPYPPLSSLNHLFHNADYQPRLICESELSFEAHLSGFVYKVRWGGMPYIKKEIPGPDTVDEFLYEVNALYALHDSQYVIGLDAIVTDQSGQIIKGLLINYAERGAAVDLLYDYKGEIEWTDRERWARHAIQGLSEIHEEGYVQGDFTLSNIVVDHNNNARIIDINRRGCPVGWEPPEIARKIASNQRISMYIGQKSDLYQLGMTLWALAMDDDEPERHDPPLSTQEFPAEVPQWYQEIVRICLSPKPRERLSATELLKFFPPEDLSMSSLSQNGRPVVRIRTEKQYIDPAAAVERDDLERLRNNVGRFEEEMYSPESSREDHTFTWPQSSSYDRDYDSGSSEIERPRGRRRISDHDSELQAQRRRERHLNERPNGIITSDDQPPIVSISSDGTRSYIVSTEPDGGPMNENANRGEEEGEPFNSPPRPMSQPSPALPPLSDRLLFPSFSDTSGDTPRNSTFQLFDTRTASPDHTSEINHPEDISGALTGLGGHPNITERDVQHTTQDLEKRGQPSLISSAPALSFVDSGYNEPTAFGIEPDDEGFSDNERGSSAHESSSYQLYSLEEHPAVMPPHYVLEDVREASKELETQERMNSAAEHEPGRRPDESLCVPEKTAVEDISVSPGSTPICSSSLAPQTNAIEPNDLKDISSGSSSSLGTIKDELKTHLNHVHEPESTLETTTEAAATKAVAPS